MNTSTMASTTLTTLNDVEKAASQPTTTRELDLDETRPGYDAPPLQKCLVVFATSWITLASCFSSTSLFSASSEVAADFGTTADVINASSAGLILAMGLSNFIWGPITQICGRLIAYNACIIVLLLFTVAGALAPNLASFSAVRVLSGFQGTFFQVTGQALLAEYFPPTQRGTATGLFLAGTVLGPPMGPLVAGIIVTYQSWRVILWVQSGMVALGLMLSLVVLREGGTRSKASEEHVSVKSVLTAFSPWRILKLMRYPNVFLTNLSAGLLSWSQYAILSSPRQILSTQYGLTSPLISGLFYLSPAAGFLAGVLVGGRFSDRTVRAWIRRRDGLRLPQDRLRSGMLSWFVLIPAFSLTFGWCVEFNAGGLAVPIVTDFFTSAAILAAFAGLNTYCAEVMPESRLEVMSGKYLLQYCFSAATAVASVPLIESVGAGVQSTISVAFILLGGVLCLAVALYGVDMQRWVDRRREVKKQAET